ncbi:unnamed protein product [Lactuca virosa]|uniref:Helicase C-terminal domain-containing protein n=1 Tax=Lactuca virosa TaxID=75947 RepID=A0AAU9LH99_9ASTR|nr:unnamed protein product [Lactuca virosa]
MHLQNYQGIGAPIFLLTPQVAGLGLTLTKADRVIVDDPVWNPRFHTYLYNMYREYQLFSFGLHLPRGMHCFVKKPQSNQSIKVMNRLNKG